MIVQWDKEDCADLGIIKVDLLGLGMMSALQDALALLRGTGVEIDLAHLPPDDPKVYEMLRKADTVGVFQVESRAQMATLPRMKPDHFYDLVVEVAIIRPGPIVGKMVHPYLRRRNGQEPVGYLHPSLEPILKRTLGVPLFQEQLLRIAMTVAGFTGGEAEELRRAMGFKRSEKRMKAIEARLRAGMAERGITGEAADTIVRSISSFALYGFPESHAASFALIAYASAYLKCHHPAAFTCALLNNQPMGFYHPFTLVKDAQRHGVRFRPGGRDAQRALLRAGGGGGAARPRLRARPAGGGGGAHRGRAGASALRVAPGLRGPDGPAARRAAQPGRGGRPQRLRPDAAERPLAGREGGPAEGTARCHPEGLRLREGRSLRGTVAVRGIRCQRNRRDCGSSSPGRTKLLGMTRLTGGSPLPEMAFPERLASDLAGTGLTVGPHPVSLFREELLERGVRRAADLPRLADGERVRVAGAVICRQRPGTAAGFLFLTLEDETGLVNVIVRPDLFHRERAVLVGEAVLEVDGVLQASDGLSVRAFAVRKALAGVPATPARELPLSRATAS